MTTSSQPGALTADAVAERVQAFLAERTKQTWEPDTDLFASGTVTSMFAMELVVHLESTFDVVIDGPDLGLDSFRTVNTMTTLVLRLREAGR
ncbi:acyl carrier protein [Actinosynnema pretiosum subsp. pretiosum]|uniref:Acyl carrier protein n=1 Tax=Actinosynnema pretiosum subsp. pretiosum TaxID=103721 RepID=B5A9R2_9PSEU|nr:MbcJ [Actinosynnema pretiosum subsp. pretiosum]AXX30647.1 Acyl carrier protein [Actinosynnema pretiosum subsp. pretiosum]QUF05225.1 acyl carrier protein [Actinosynnema pretiosum subsp. pretiosum]